MPKELSTHPEPYQHQWTPGARYDKIFTGWAYPPKDYEKWGELVLSMGEALRRAIRAQAKSSRGIGKSGTSRTSATGTARRRNSSSSTTTRSTACGARCPRRRSAGADTAGSGGRFTRDFLEHCLRGTNYATGKIGTPLDFVSFHAKGAPSFTNDHVRMGIGAQLRTIDDGVPDRRVVSRIEETSRSSSANPIRTAAPRVEAAVYPAYRNGHDVFASYTAASVRAQTRPGRTQRREPRRRADLGVRIRGPAAMFAGFRTLASNGIDKPVLNVFRMFSKMTGQRVSAESDGAVPLDEIMRRGVRGQPDVSALASLDQNKLCVMVWHYHDDDVPGPVADVRLEVAGVPMWIASARVEHYRIDDEHSNAYTVWQQLGSPQQPTKDQYAQIEKAGKLAKLDQPRPFPFATAKRCWNSSCPAKRSRCW